MKSFNKTIEGYYRNPQSLPTHKGVYFVYRATYDAAANTVDLKELIYIGEAENINQRVTGHNRFEDWKKKLRSGEILCWSQCAEAIDRKTLEAALIFKHKPPLNVEFVNSFPFETTSVALSGATALLQTSFVLRESVLASLYR
jgi:excinuclease UvrABC nuclease subunit